VIGCVGDAGDVNIFLETFFKSVVTSNLYAEGLKEVTVIVERG